MTWKRNTVDHWEVLGHYAQGWECVSAYNSLKEARQGLKEYAAKEFCTAFTIRKVRERLPRSGPVEVGKVYRFHEDHSAHLHQWFDDKPCRVVSDDGGGWFEVRFKNGKQIQAKESELI